MDTIAKTLPEPGPVAAAIRQATELTVGGMNCNNCVRHVVEAAQSVSGVQSATANLETGRATVRWSPGIKADPSSVIAAIAAKGFKAKPVESCGCHAEGGEHQLAGWQLNLWVGVLGMLPLMLGEWVFRLGMTPWFHWFSFAVAGVVQVFAGGRFYRGAWNQLRTGSSNMDTLVALGSTTAFGYSTWALFTGQPGHLYFMDAVSIITLVSAGHWLESRASSRASGALRELMSLAPPAARRLGPKESIEEVPVAQLQPGDAVVLRPGERVPTDGEVLEGESSVEEAMLTGESIPVEKSKGSPLYAGTVNLNGRLIMRVTQVGEETALAHVIAAVQRAQASRADIQRLGDRVSSIFVPVVVAVALLAALWWGLAPASASAVQHWLAGGLWFAHAPQGHFAAAFIVASAVLIVACPCAMGLATPVAIMAGANAAARRGILIRDGIALEKAGRIDSVLLDKTGTLTLGNPSLVQVWEASGAGEGALELAGALAAHSNHPFSLAIAGFANGAVQVEQWEEFRGAGIAAQASFAGRPAALTRLGSLRWLGDAGLNIQSLAGMTKSPGEKSQGTACSAEQFIQTWSQQGATLLGLSHGNQWLGLFALRDAIKPGAAAVVAKLKAAGLATYLVTGDNALTASAVAREAGIVAENVFAEIRPERKAEIVQRLQQQGKRIAFVGDGINDAPALEQADLGIAVSRASDLAREAADIILLKSEIEAVPEALGLARATLRKIKQNLFWAFFYNVASIPLAALGVMSPILCAAAMGFSDLIVVGNALRLRSWKSSAGPRVPVERNVSAGSSDPA